MSNKAGLSSSDIVKPVAIPDQVADHLREKILYRGFKPGQRIVETAIAKQLKISQATVREALAKLEDDGLITRSPNRGCTVSRLTKTEYNQLFSVRIELETLAVQLATLHHSQPGVKELSTVLRELKNAAKSGQVENFYRADLKVHRTIWKLSNNPFLERALSQLILPLFAFVIFDAVSLPGCDLVGIAQEHEKLADGILARDEAHSRNICRAVLRNFRRAGEVVFDGSAWREDDVVGVD